MPRVFPPLKTLGIISLLLSAGLLQPTGAVEALRILYVGNSITRHEPSPSLGWNQSSGMAANSQETDYAHRFRDVVAHTTGRPVEMFFHTFGGGGKVSHRLAAWSEVAGVNPHIVVIQLGEHEEEADGTTQLRLDYRALLELARSGAARPWVVALGSWSPQTTGPPNAYDNGWVGQRDAVFREEAEALGLPFISVRSIAEVSTNWGTGSDAGVQWHPNDAGHAQYARFLANTFLQPHHGFTLDGDGFVRPGTPLTGNIIPHPAGAAWHAFTGDWAIINNRLYARRTGTASHALALYRPRPLTYSTRNPPRITAEIQMTDSSSSSLSGIAVGDQNAFYALRYSRAGLVQFVRVTGDSTTALYSQSFGSNRFEVPARLTVEALKPGVFRWSITGSGGFSREGTVTDPTPLSGIYAGLYTTLTADANGTPRAYFNRFAVTAPAVAFLDRFERANQSIAENMGPDFTSLRGWRTLEGAATWEVRFDRLMGNQAGTPPSILINDRAPTQSTPFTLRADLTLNSENTAHWAGAVFHASSPGNGYILRFNRAGAVQLLRVREGQTTVLENRSVGSNRLDGQVSLRVEGLRSDRFRWSLHNRRGEQVIRRTTTDPLPLRGGRAGLYLNTPVQGDLSGVEFHRFSLNPEAARITLDPNPSSGTGFRQMLGQLIVGADPAGVYYASNTPEYFATRRGHGIWEASARVPEPEPFAILQNYQPGVLRYPDGLGVHAHNWRHTVGPLFGSSAAPDDFRSRTYRFGLNEFLGLARQAGAEPVIVVSEYVGTNAAGENDLIASAADLVAYLNLPVESNHPMALLRQSHGFTQPWGVRYFEIGNESWVDYRLNFNEALPPTQVGLQAAAMITAMKAIDPDILCGVPYHLEDKSWGDAVFLSAGNAPDYAIFHVYPISYGGQNLALNNNGAEAWLENRLLQTTLLSGVAGWASIRENLDHLRQVTGRPTLPVAITEYNVGMAQSGVAHAYRFSLAAAIGMGDLVARMAAHQDDVLFGVYWQWLNGFWGSVRHANLSTLMFQYSQAGNFPPVIESLRAPHHLFASLGPVAAGRSIPVLYEGPVLEGPAFGRSYPTVAGPAQTASRRSSQNLILNNLGLPRFTSLSPNPEGLTGSSFLGTYTLRFSNFTIASTFPGFARVEFNNLSANLRPPSERLIYRARFEARWEPDDITATAPTLGVQIGDQRGFTATGSARYVDTLQTSVNVWTPFEIEYQPRPDATGLSYIFRIQNPGTTVNGTLRLRNFVLEAWNAPTLEAPPAITTLASHSRSPSGAPQLEAAFLNLSDFEERLLDLEIPGTGNATASLQIIRSGTPAAYRAASEQSTESPDPGGALILDPISYLPVTEGRVAFLLPAHSIARLSLPLPDPRTAFEKWRDEVFGLPVTDDPELEQTTWGAAADPFRTGRPNFLSFALGHNPADRVPGSLTPVAWRQGGAEIRFFRARADLTYRVEVSSNLSDWEPLATNPGQPGSWVTVIDPQPQPRRFYRLKVTDF